MAGLIAMTAVLMVVGIEMFFTTRGAGHIHGNDYGNSPEEEGHIGHTRKSSGHTRSRNHRPQQLKLQGVHGDEDLSGSDLEARGGSSDHLIWGKKSTPNESPTTEGATKYLDNNSEAEAEDSDLDLDELDPTVDNANLLRFNHTFPARSRGSSYIQPPSTPSIHSSSVSDTQLQQKLILQCFLLEAGILFHSIFIGMALSISVGAPFIVLLIAISFHQTFEGFALGSRIAAIPSFSTTSPKPWLMALAYGLTTPIGQAIGLAVHRLYDPQSQTGLLTVGVTNAVSSGLLLFAGLVELLAEDFLSEGSYASLKGKKRLQACGAVVGGAALMALVGAWA
ncbi:hypothetical protein MMC14_005455 [Varicellaria rhodocarpa]|nr:hypothetical protein [Varicellaria rhodocarpa]